LQLHWQLRLLLTKSESLAGSANNSSLDVLAAKQSVLVRHAVKSASRSSVAAGAEIVVVLDREAVFVGELRGQSVLDVDEDIALDKGLGACQAWSVSAFFDDALILEF
jgi:hypothetical protein